jgi:hypothetical protein
MAERTKNAAERVADSLKAMREEGERQSERAVARLMGELKPGGKKRKPAPNRLGWFDRD